MVGVDPVLSAPPFGVAEPSSPAWVPGEPGALGEEATPEKEPDFPSHGFRTSCKRAVASRSEWRRLWCSLVGEQAAVAVGEMGDGEIESIPPAMASEP